MSLSKKTYHLITLYILIFSLTFCSKENKSSSTYPKQVNVTYKVSSTTTSSAVILTFKNETGTDIVVTNPSLPYTKFLIRTVNKNDILSLGYGTNSNQTVKLEILVNNIVVKTQTFTSTSGAINYLFD